ncbi:MAG: polysaccharide biosynthesis tyrosine autokinase [Bifidobacteriaceae bacterium]|jgi:capsular exopolysaccharide synthesis family protein|nr:polysaccharide biosynthesis tyrosine autokinase [Bifidobacteriaceae bacterium]
MRENADDTEKNQQTESASLDIEDFWASLKRHLKLIFVTTVVVALCTVVVVFAIPKKFTATAKLFATYNAAQTAHNANSISVANSYVQNQIKSYPSLAKTDAVLGPVISNLGLSQTVADLSKMVNVSTPSGTMFINVSAVAGDATSAQKIANGVADSLRTEVSSELYSESSSLVKLSLVQKADMPLSESSPKKVPYIVSGIIAGLILGVLIALLRDLSDKKIRSIADVQAIAEMPLLGSIPRNDELNATTPILVSQPNSREAEDYRGIRTNLSFITPQENAKARLIVFASAGPREGKTTTAVNTAVALAENGASVLLIDADLRHPSVGAKLGLNDAVGLAHVLSSQISFSDAVQRYWKPNLHILPAGPQPPNAAVLLNSRIMEMLITQASQQYDYVLIDTSPIDVSADALVFGKMGNGVLLVVGRDIGERKELRSVASRLANAAIPVIGLVLNFAEQPRNLGKNYYYSNGNKGEKSRKGRKLLWKQTSEGGEHRAVI